MNFKIVVSVCCFTLVICFLFQQYYYTPSLPFGDDLPTIFDFILHFEEADSLQQKLSIIYNNRFLEHRLLSSSLITLLIYYVSGTVPLQCFTVVAGLFWTSLLAFYYKFLKKSSLSIEWLLPITCVLLASASYQTMYWPMAALQHFLVIFLAIITMSFLCMGNKLSNKLFLLSIAIGLLTTFSSGNGLAVWPSGLLVLLVRKENKFLLFWIACMIIAVFLYFWNFSLSGSPSSQSARAIFSHSFTKIITFLAGLGSAIRFKGVPYFFDNMDVPFSLKYPAIYVGAFSILIFIWMLKRSFSRYDINISFILGVSTFVFISFALIVLGRFTDSESITTLKSRYCPYSLVVICNTICLTAIFIEHTKWYLWYKRLVSFFGITFWVIWQILAFHKIVNHNNMLETGFFNWQHNNRWIIYQQTAFYENYYNNAFDKMKKMKFPFQSPSTPMAVAFNFKQNISNNFSRATCQISEKDNKVTISVWNESESPVKVLGEGSALIMASSKDTFLLWSTVNRPSIHNLLFKGQVCGSGYFIEATLNKQAMPKGIYSLYQFRFSNGQGFFNNNVLNTISM